MSIKNLLARAARNWPAKALSVALAIVIFVFHRLSVLEERFFSVPLTIEGSGNLVPSKSYPRMIRVSLRGDANTIYPILEDDIEAFIDLEKFTSPGDYRAEVGVRKKGTALGVQPLEIGIDPIDINISLDNRSSRFVPLIPNLRGSVESGFVLSSHSMDPTQVAIEGPLALVETVSGLYTDFVDLDGRNADFSTTVNILNRDPLIVIRGSGTTEFRGFVSKIVPVRNINGLPIGVSGLAPGFTAELERKTGAIHLEGESQEALDRFNPSVNFLSVDCSGIGERGTYTLKVNSGAVPFGLDLSFEPSEVTVVVEDEDAEAEGGE